MILSNINNLTIIIFIILLFLGSFLIFSIYKKNKNKRLVFLYLSFIFLIINIFQIKGGINFVNEDNEGGKIVFAIDVSKSMLAQDIEYSNGYTSRLDGVKTLVQNYTLTNKYNLYGLLVFAGESLEVLPFTDDLGIFETFLIGVNNSNVSKYGTNLNSVFESIFSYFIGEEKGGLVVIFTDGGDEDIKISSKKIELLKEKGIKVLLVGIGGINGTKIVEGHDFLGRKIYKKYLGKDVVTKLNNDVLKNISSKYDIDYINIDNLSDMKDIDGYINKNIELLSINRDLNNRNDYTRVLVFISIFFFLLFLLTDFVLGRKK